MFVPLLVAALNAGQRLQLFIGLSDGGSVRLEETVITAQDCHDRHALLCRTLEVVTDDVRVALLQLFSTRGLPREDGQEGLVLPLNFSAFDPRDFGAFADPCSDHFFVLAVIVVGGIMIGQPLRAIPHFPHGPHGGGECQKTMFSVKSKKGSFGAETQYVQRQKRGERARTLSSVGRITILLQHCLSRRSKINRDGSLFISFD